MMASDQHASNLIRGIIPHSPIRWLRAFLVFPQPARSAHWRLCLESLACAIACLVSPGTPAAPLAVAGDLALVAKTVAAPPRPILMFFTQPACPFCERARRAYIRPLSLDQDWTSRTLSIEIARDRPLLGFDGKPTTGAELARHYAIRAYPTVIYVDSTGAVLAKPIVGITVPDFYGAYLAEGLQGAQARLADTRGALSGPAAR